MTQKEILLKEIPRKEILLKEILLNGEKKLVSCQTLEELIQTLQLGEKKIAVEVNREIISRSLFPETRLQAGDQVEVVHFVGGG